MRPGEVGTTKEQRVQATRDQCAADRSLTSWAYNHAATLRQLAGTITALPDLPSTATNALAAIRAALGHSDPAQLHGPLSEAGPHPRPAHPDLADRVTDIGGHTHGLRENEHRQSSNGP
ncbi:hypothetical protein [Streptomyces rhizosphaerihabitans]|uniref:hypothetical protein n=1 Tax=Streptomyces rhizosphaerihabitans TaxID=1266770 RepID=UPI0021C001A0|nr:hypothetical protein [Streptomyces rhizosphaerihabitans]MCT9010772.1 hypothetical protein [Streptomyces rhizosphaerihabitans]